MSESKGMRCGAKHAVWSMGVLVVCAGLIGGATWNAWGKASSEDVLRLAEEIKAGERIQRDRQAELEKENVALRTELATELKGIHETLTELKGDVRELARKR
jgi:hypothetical protein